ncbi:MAG: HEAT repeat domain-containing protein [Gemmatimonadota bacterium]|nr:HEAT repeat domain-containing protein [Gemmatimonadota bacterium]
MRNTLLRLTVVIVAVSATSVAQGTRPPAPPPPPPPAPPVAPVPPLAPLPPLPPLRAIDIDDALDVDARVSRAMNLPEVREAMDRVNEARFDFGVGTFDFPSAEDFNLNFASAGFGMSERPRAPWATGDPADSLYRLARESLNSGEYRKAAQLFALISQKYPNSQYRADASYWRAFSLYRIGGIADLHEALQTLESAPPDTASRSTSVAVSNAVRLAGLQNTMTVQFNRPRTDAAVLAMRIRGALAARGDAAAAAQLARSADASTTSCDDEDAQLRIEALNALVQMDPKSAEPAVTRVLARRDACSAPLRRGALALIARNRDAHTTDLLINTAQSDPDLTVRSEAISLLGRASDDRGTAALTRFATSAGNPALQRIAVRALATQDSPAARQSIRDLMSRTDIAPDVRLTALHYAGSTGLQVAELGRIYDGASDRATRMEVVSLLDQRDDPQAADRLFDIARTSTDPMLRRRAIDALARRKDPRTAKLLMEIVDK